VQGAINVERSKPFNCASPAGRHELSSKEGNMVMKVTANLIVRIWDVRRAEKQARTFYCPGADHEMIRREREFPAIVVADMRQAYPASVARHCL
jgi:hypothetical protein